MSGSIERYVLDRLVTDERYVTALSGSTPEIRSHIEGTVTTFVGEIARCLDGMVEILKDPEVQAKFMAKYGKR